MSEGKITALEGLRGYLSLWVVGEHVLKYAGVIPQHGVLAAVADSSHAVTGFMILSGFVISMLLERRQEVYSRYLLRRWMRLFPALLVTMVVAWMIFPLWTALLDDWYPAFADGGITAAFRGDARHVIESPWAYLAAVLSMANGMIPDQWMPGVAVAFIGVVWSLSLEMQFYLVAPWLWRTMHRLRGASWLALLVLAVFLILRQPVAGKLGLMTWKSFLPMSLEWFLLGMLSQMHYSGLVASAAASTGKVKGDALAIVLLMFLVIQGDDLRRALQGNPIVLTGGATAMWIWAACYAWMCDCVAGRGGLLHRMVDRALNNRAALFLGKISYSVYLCHVPVIMLVHLALSRSMALGTSGSVAVITACLAVPLTLFVSWLSYLFVESPMIRWAAAKCRS